MCIASYEFTTIIVLRRSDSEAEYTSFVLMQYFFNDIYEDNDSMSCIMLLLIKKQAPAAITSCLIFFFSEYNVCLIEVSLHYKVIY